MKPVLLDTGVIVALLDRSERFHQACADAIAEISAPLVTCEAVIAESCYLLRSLKGASEVVVENVSAGMFQIPVPLQQASREVGRILHRYRDQKVDLADACLVHLAEHFQTGQILSLDRDFEIYRWGRNRSFELLVPLA